MGAVEDWQCFLRLPDEASAVPVAHYLRSHDCPARVFVEPLGFQFGPTAQILVPAEFLSRAQHVWSRAGTLGALSDAELEYLATGRLPACADAHDDAA